MSSKHRKIVCVVVLFCAQLVAVAQSQSVFLSVFSNANFFSNDEVLKSYIGSWAGTQVVKFGQYSYPGKIEITYSPILENSTPKLMGVGRITSQNGDSIPTTSYMYVKNDTLILEMRTESGEVSFYKGFIEDRSVVWVPLYDFLLYDYQQDFFFEKDGKRFINAVGSRYFSFRGQSGMLEIKSQFEKLEDAYSADKVNRSVKRDINIRLDSGGVKFGK